MPRSNRTALSALALTLAAPTAALADDFVGFGPRTVGFEWISSNQYRGAFQVETADLNADGHMDIVVAGNRGITVLLNDGSGGFGAEQYYESATFSDRNIVVGDFNNDGFPDVASVAVSTEIEVWMNQGDGTFAPRISTPAPWTTGSVPTLSMGDADGDGDIDLFALPGLSPGNIHIFENNGSGAFSLGQIIPSPAASDTAWRMAVGDVNGNGSPDIAHLARHGSGGFRLTTYSNDGSGNFIVAFESSSFGGSMASNDAKLIDIDLDGDLDWVQSTGASGLTIVRNNGLGAFSQRSDYPSGVNITLEQLAAADIDGDGFPDVAAGSSFVGVTVVYCNDGLGGFLPPTTYASPSSTRPPAVALADVDGNGTPDLVSVAGGINSFNSDYLNLRLNLTDVAPPGPFTLLSPADDAAGLALPENITGWNLPAPRFQWSLPSGFQTTYDLTVTTATAPFAVVYSATGITERSHPVPQLTLESGTEYEWQVTANNAVGSTESSLPHRFTTAEGPRLCEPDANGDGQLNVFDVLRFLQTYSAGCP